MTDVQRVSRPGSPFSDRDRALALVVTIGVLVAIAKPWGGDAGPVNPVIPFPSRPAPSAEAPLPGRPYEPELFGPFEPAPSWSIWPAGYFVSVKYVTRRGQPGSEPGPSPSGSPAPSGTVPSSAPPSTEAARGPDWPPIIEVGPGDHLLWLGVDTPLGWTIRSSTLTRIGPDGRPVDVPITRLPSDWDDHFAVLGIPVAGRSDRLTDWPRGEYRLTITVDPGGLARTIVVRIETLPDSVRGASQAP